MNTGFVNSWFAWLPGVGTDTDWFGGTVDVAACHLPRGDWKTTPFISLLCWPASPRCPDGCQEAAQVDGATWWQRMRRVTCRT